jgi:hypothetical protein
MVLYNVTTKIDHTAHAKWLQWMQHAYIPHLMDSNTIDHYHLCRLRGVDESDGVIYALLLRFSSRPAFDIYQEQYALDHQKMHDKEFKGKYVSFPSLLDVVAHGE